MEKTFYIAGVQFYQLKNIIGDLKEGDHLDITAEPDNQYDSNAVKITYKDTMLGYVPRTISSDIAAMLDIGSPHKCTITTLTPENKPWEQCEVTIAPDDGE